MDSYFVQGSKNIIGNIIKDNIGSVTFNLAETSTSYSGLNIIGNTITNNQGNVVINLYNNPDYQKVISKIRSLTQYLEQIPHDKGSERLSVSKDIEQLQTERKNIEEGIIKILYAFNSIEDNITIDRVKKLFIEGKTDEALNILSSNDIDQKSDFLIDFKKKIDESVTKNEKDRKEYSEILLIRALFKENNELSENSFELVEKDYKKSIELFENYINLFYFALFYQKNNLHHQSLSIYKNIFKTYNEYSMNSRMLADAYQNVGAIHFDLREYEIASKVYWKAISIYFKFEFDNDTAEGLLTSFLNLVNVHTFSNNFEESYKAITLAESTIKMFEKNKNVSLKDYHKLHYFGIIKGLLFFSEKKFEDAEIQFSKILKMFQQNPAYSSDKYLEENSTVHNNLGLIYTMMYEYEKALYHYNHSLNNRKKLISINPYRYYPLYSTTLLNLGMVYMYLQKYEDSLKHLKECYSSYQRLIIDNFDVYGTDYLKACGALGLLYRRLNDIDNMKYYYEESLDYYKKLFEEKPDIYGRDYALISNNYGAGLLEFNEKRKAEKHIKIALDIREIWALRNPEVFEADFAETLQNYSNILTDLDEAKKYTKQCLEIYERLTRKSFEVYSLRTVAVANNYILLLIQSFERSKRSDKLTLREAIEYCYDSWLLLHFTKESKEKEHYKLQLDDFLRRLSFNYPYEVELVFQVKGHLVLLLELNGSQREYSFKIEQITESLLGFNKFDSVEDYLKLKISKSCGYGTLAWLYILNGQYDLALSASKNALSIIIAKETEWIHTNYALSLLLTGDVDKAYKIYSEFWTKPYPEEKKYKTYSEAFLDDIKQLEELGVKYSEFNIIKQLNTKCM